MVQSIDYIVWKVGYIELLFTTYLFFVLLQIEFIMLMCVGNFRCHNVEKSKIQYQIRTWVYTEFQIATNRIQENANGQGERMDDGRATAPSTLYNQFLFLSGSCTHCCFYIQLTDLGLIGLYISLLIPIWSIVNVWHFLVFIYIA